MAPLVVIPIKDVVASSVARRLAYTFPLIVQESAKSELHMPNVITRITSKR